MLKDAVLLVCDGAYLPPALFVASQLDRHPRRTFDIVVATVGFEAELWRPQMPGVRFLPVDPGKLTAISHSNRKSAATFVRLKMDEILRGYRRVLYLDCDVWVARPERLDALFAMDLGGLPMAAVLDAAEVTRPDSPEWIAYKRQLGLADDAPYFNSGVLLLDLEKFSAERIGAKAIEYLAAGRFRGPFHDQSALNSVAAGRWLELPASFNWMFATRADLTQKHDPAIVHFIGPNKPWRDRKAKHAPFYREEMARVLAGLGLDGWVEQASRLYDWRRAAANAVSQLTTRRRAARIDRHATSHVLH